MQGLLSLWDIFQPHEEYHPSPHAEFPGARAHPQMWHSHNPETQKPRALWSGSKGVAAKAALDARANDPRNPGTNTKEFISCQDQWRHLEDFLHGRFGTWTLSRGVPPPPCRESSVFSQKEEGRGTTDSQTLWLGGDPTASSQGPGRTESPFSHSAPFNTQLLPTAPLSPPTCFPSKPRGHGEV